ncbi:VPLPA-CTERM-specific exosortase XrtD [Geomonas oryzae]|uniref:VPLPA-CTERM-specific exosortase XrtD n=1 Tax=Geomonas oryzae TaxID=2364273 RepID=UPI001FEB3F1D|nr:VPLPA-CTERM-specific exosortase XrtD [Geomonas oryzae]
MHQRVLASIYLILLLLLFRESTSYLIRMWNGEEHTYCYVVPFIVGYLLWDKRCMLRARPSTPSAWGLLPLGVGILLYLLGDLGGEFYTLFLSSWCMVAGLLLMHLGWQKLRVILFPLLFSMAIFPFPGLINNTLSLNLKLVSSALGVHILQVLGVTAFREGNVIDLGFTRLQVVDACSGLRYLLPLLILGVLLAYFFRAPFWKRALLVVSTVPLTIIVNGMRIASVGLLYPVFGAQVAEGFFHDFSGWLIFMVSLVALLGEMRLLKRLPENPAEPSSPKCSRHDIAAGGASALWLKWCAALLLAGLVITVRVVDFRERVPLAKPLSEFPRSLGQWQGNRLTMERATLDSLKPSDYLLADFRDTGAKTVSLYVAYNESQRKGESSHSPSSCLPGSGWLFEGSGLTMLPIGPRGELCSVNRAALQKNGERLLVYYWFPQRGRVLTNMLELKLYAFWDALMLRRTDGALVRLITPIDAGEQAADSERRVADFARQAMPVLATFLPSR